MYTYIIIVFTKNKCLDLIMTTKSKNLWNKNYIQIYTHILKKWWNRGSDLTINVLFIQEKMDIFDIEVDIL